jgi:hypothetical protein
VCGVYVYVHTCSSNTTCACKRSARAAGTNAKNLRGLCRGLRPQNVPNPHPTYRHRHRYTRTHAHRQADRQEGTGRQAGRQALGVKLMNKET